MVQENASLGLFTPKSAVSYLRVSTRGQAERGGGADEGFSIPAQREANRRKASSLGAVIVKEFVDRGSSAKSAHRKDLQAMLQYVKEVPPDYVIIHKVDRLARNRGDDVDIMRILTENNIKLISASESIDETPSGMLLHGIMSSIAEFYSRNLATEVLKGMNEKVKAGGTIGKAPLGYLNERRMDERGREERCVIIDEERAPLIREAFQMYATGDWVVADLAEYFAVRGLTTRATPEIPSKPINYKSLNKVLINSYYKGIVTFKGKEYEGNHEPLVDEVTWQRVQDVLLSHVNGERNRKHIHFLKSVVFCGSCGDRLLVQHSKSKSGIYYPYFSCAGRKGRRSDCLQKSALIAEVEEKIEELFVGLSFTKAFRKEVEKVMLSEIEEMGNQFAEERKEIDTEKTKIRRKQEKLLEAHYADAIPLDLFKKEQKKLAELIGNMDMRIQMHEENGKDVKERLGMVLDILEDCGMMYRNAPDGIKRTFCQIFFERILVHVNGDGGMSISPNFTFIFALIFNQDNCGDFPSEINEMEFWSYFPKKGEKDEKNDLPKSVQAVSPLSETLMNTGESRFHFQMPTLNYFFERCLHKSIIVDLGGVEPPSKNPSHVLLLS